MKRLTKFNQWMVRVSSKPFGLIVVICFPVTFFLAIILFLIGYPFAIAKKWLMAIDTSKVMPGEFFDKDRN